MENQNIEEYKFIRKELVNLRNCITTYIGYVFGGSGIAIFGFAAIAQNPGSFDVVGYSCFLISVFISLFLLILMYKFNSYNRYAGYCKLLNQEKFYYPDNLRGDDQYMSWEICMDILRESDLKQSVLLDKCKNIKIQGLDKKNIINAVQRISGPDPSADKHIHFKGFKTIINAILGNVKTSSWHFPNYVVALFFLINLGFLIAGFYFLLTSYNSNQSSVVLKQLIFVLPIICILPEIFLWCTYCKKIYSLSEGSSIIDAFCWKFLPIRYEYIRKQNPDVKYRLITLKRIQYS